MYSGNPRGRGETEGRRKNTVKTMAEIFQNVIKDMNPDSLEAQQTPGRINAKRSTPRHVIIKLLEVNDTEKTLKAAREKQLVTYRRSSVRVTENFLPETTKARKEWHDTFRLLKENCQPRILYLVNLPP